LYTICPTQKLYVKNSIRNGNTEHRTRIHGIAILKWIFSKWDVEVWTGSSWLRIGTGGGNSRMRE